MKCRNIKRPVVSGNPFPETGARFIHMGIRRVYAIIKAGGKQYRVAPNDVIAVNRLAATEGDQIVIDEVLLVSDDKGVNIGAPYVEGPRWSARSRGTTRAARFGDSLTNRRKTSGGATATGST